MKTLRTSELSLPENIRRFIVAVRLMRYAHMLADEARNEVEIADGFAKLFIERRHPNAMEWNERLEKAVQNYKAFNEAYKVARAGAETALAALSEDEKTIAKENLQWAAIS